MGGSREISLVPSLHRASTDALIIIWSVVGITVCYKFVWSPLHDLLSSADVQQCEGNTPILGLRFVFCRGFFRYSKS